MPPEDCIYYQVTDFERYLKTLRQSIGSLLNFSVSMSDPGKALGGPAGVVQTTDSSEANASLIKKLQELLPSEEELEGTTGVSVGQLTPSQNGIIFRAAWKCPRRNNCRRDTPAAIASPSARTSVPRVRCSGHADGSAGCCPVARSHGRSSPTTRLTTNSGV